MIHETNMNQSRGSYPKTFTHYYKIAVDFLSLIFIKNMYLMEGNEYTVHSSVQHFGPEKNISKTSFTVNGFV